ncbi:Fc.00g104710.m01.CDS01 [Cosmosporella sp. VM-42]
MAQNVVFDKYNPSLRWAFQPVIDGDVIPRPPLESWRHGTWHKVPIMTGFTKNEGSLYVDKQLSQSDQFTSFFAELLPLLTQDDIATIDKLYPDPLTNPESTYKDAREGVVRQTAESASAAMDLPVYLYQWALKTSLLDGAHHDDNMRYEACDPNVLKISTTQEVLSRTLNAYVTRFITRGDPNAAGGEFASRPEWIAYNRDNPKAMVFGAKNKELVGGAAAAPAELLADDWGKKESQFATVLSLPSSPEIALVLFYSMRSVPEDDIPTFRIDLARPPELRYVDVAAAYGPRIRSLGNVFDEILDATLQYKWLVYIAKFAARVLLRGVYDGEQTREIKGFAKASGVDLYLIVALNVFLDAMMGCTAGCVRVNAKRSADETSGNSMMHFRTLDWGVDALRDLVIIVEHIDTSKDPDHIIATSITYSGFVGILTGLRENLSISLNYRPIHLCSNSALKKHQTLVVLGFRPSISSVIRSVVLDPRKWTDTSTHGADEKSLIISHAEMLSVENSSPCYLTLCDGKQGVVIEKDLATGRIKAANDFIVQTNHDSDHSSCCGADTKQEDQPLVPHNELWLQDSTDRMGVIQRKWIDHTTTDAEQNDHYLDQARGNGTCISRHLTQIAEEIDMEGISEQILRDWMKDEQISNAYTHFACIMDPVTGKIRWLQRGPKQLSCSVEMSFISR